MLKKEWVLFITTSSLATNPRLVKEFETLKDVFECHVICFKHHDWSLELSEAIKVRNPEVHFIEIDRRVDLFSTLLSKLIHKVAILLNPLFKGSTMISAFASNDKTPQLLFKSFQLSKEERFKTIIAHNLGSFYPSLIYAKDTNAQLQLDIEDYHPGEEFYFNETHELQNRLSIMQDAFNQATVITYASEGIKLNCEAVFKLKSQTKQAVIINAFKADDFSKPTKQGDALNFVWFSQNISPKRGLEAVFAVAKDFPHMRFHLIGKANEGFIESMALSENIIIYKPMHQDALHEFLSTMDVGLALENKHGDGNRDICLTNKFLAYAQAGLYIIATDTFGQSHFMDQSDHELGVIIQSNLLDTLQQMDRNVLDTENRIERWEKAKDFSWEQQSKLLMQVMA